MSAETALTVQDQVLASLRSGNESLASGGSGKLDRRVGIITGVGPESGIGAAAARLFAREGARHLYLIDRNDTHIQPLLHHLNLLYPSTKTTFHLADAASPLAIWSIINAVLEEEGRLDFFFANAGMLQVVDPKFGKDKDASARSYGRAIGEIGEDEVCEIFRINALAPYIAIKYASAAMSRLCPEKGKTIPGGSIVLTASVGGLKANAGPIPYSAAKASVISMAQTSAFALTGTNIRVNAICPGFIDTDMTKDLTESARANNMDDGTMLNPTLRRGLGMESAKELMVLERGLVLY
ncbi:hypothetical protein B9479_005428 [Cryptococcus floricola]|uniref:Uncharacterized protein n=1 Tax=Cryptococcus floricola TaxID=2591691 RepID=A0A5D3AUR0_9TREE|nr:hypothetical protein B9479_005428 [Cryptococcus floricola]